MNSNANRLLIADADPYVRAMVGRFATEAGYSVSFACDGYEALDAARKSPPLAILADILLPRLDGLALCRLLKGDPATQGIITVVVLSILSAEESAKKAGADAFVQKPLEKKRLLRILESVVRKDKDA